MIFLPTPVIHSLGLQDFLSDYRPFLGASLIIALGVLVVEAVMSFRPAIKNAWLDYRYDKNLRISLAELTTDEKELLRRYIVGGENSLYRSINDGVATGLEAKNILYRSANISLPGVPGNLFPYNMQPFARRRLNKDSSYLN